MCAVVCLKGKKKKKGCGEVSRSSFCLKIDFEMFCPAVVFQFARSVNGFLNDTKKSTLTKDRRGGGEFFYQGDLMKLIC